MHVIFDPFELRLSSCGIRRPDDLNLWTLLSSVLVSGSLGNQNPLGFEA